MEKRKNFSCLYLGAPILVANLFDLMGYVFEFYKSSKDQASMVQSITKRQFYKITRLLGTAFSLDIPSKKKFFISFLAFYAIC